MIKVSVIYPADPLGVIPGGIDTCIRDIIRSAPDDFECRYRKACPHLFDRPALEVRHATDDYERLERRYNQTVFFDHMRIQSLEAQVESQQKHIDELKAEGDWETLTKYSGFEFDDAASRSFGCQKRNRLVGKLTLFQHLTDQPPHGSGRTCNRNSLRHGKLQNPKNINGLAWPALNHLSEATQPV